MKKLAVLKVAILAASLVSAVSITAASWSPATYVGRLEIRGGNVYVTNPEIFAACKDHAFVSLAATGGREMYSVLLAAKAARKKVKFKISGTCNPTYFDLLGVDLSE